MLCFLLSGLVQGAPLLVDFLDIGQGDAILIQGTEHTLLIDAGDRSANTEEQLHQLNITHIDWAFATHPHADHIGRMPGVLRDFSVGAYFDSGLTHTTQNYKHVMEAVAQRHIPYRPAKRGERFTLGDGAYIDVLLPDDILITGTRSDINSNSVILFLHHGEDSILFTGDAEIPTEEAIISQNIGQIDVLKVPHHGSHHSTHSAFAEALHPDFSVISVGKDNRYRHPSPETIHTLESLDSTVYRTDLSGHIRLISYGDGVEFLEGPLSQIMQIAIPNAPRPQNTRPVSPNEPTTAQDDAPLIADNAAHSQQPTASISSSEETVKKSWWRRWRDRRKDRRRRRREKKVEFYF